jgi:hypothetical protein
VIRDCITCGQSIILGRYIDNLPVVMDGKPVADGQAVLKGDLNDQPTAIFGVEIPWDAEFYGVALDADRYDQHVCPEVKR